MLSPFGSKHRMEHKEAWPENEERLLQPLQQNVPRFAHDSILDYNLACIESREDISLVVYSQLYGNVGHGGTLGGPKNNQ